MEDLYCQECGCEILSPDDIGVDETQTREEIGFYPAGRPEVEVRTVICRSCMEEHIRALEEYARSEEFRLECFINKTMKEDSTWHG